MEKNIICSSKEEIELVSVSQALRSHIGKMRVKGTVTSVTKLFKMITNIKFYCDKCKKLNELDLPQPVFKIKPEDRKCSCKNTVYNVDYNYCNVVIVELQDLETFNDLERLPVFLFDKDTENIRVGENIMIKGQIQINESGSGKKLFPYFYAESIQYDKNDSIVLTEQDIDAVKRFTKKHGSKIIYELVKIYDCSVIGYEHVKEGLLFSAVNSSGDELMINSISNFNRTRQRIHSLLIGEKGLAKSRLLRSAVRTTKNSRYESRQYSSGGSLTAIVSKEEENYVLRLGPIPLAKNAICAINEFGRRIEDQDHFLDVMEEGFFTITKYGINATIKAPTTIIASANPYGNSEWNDDDKIDIDQIPALKPVLDRFDLIFVFRGQKDEKLVRNYAYKKSDLEMIKVPDYSNYLIKHIEYAKRFNPKFDENARAMLTEFFIKIRVKGFGSNRILDTLYRLSKAIARLKLKDIVEVEDAEEVMKFYNVVLQSFEAAVSVSANPKELTYNKFMEILENSRNIDNTHVGVTIEELCRIACENDDQIASYLGDNCSIKSNHKLRSVVEIVKNSRHVRQVGLHPIILKWLGDVSDVSDVQKKISEKNIGEFVNRNTLYEESVLVKSVTPRTYDSEKNSTGAKSMSPTSPTSLNHIDPASVRKLDVSKFIKISGIKITDGIVFDPNPATGVLLLKNNFITGNLRMRADGGGRYPTNYLEFIDNVFGYEWSEDTIEVCSNSIPGLNKGRDGNCFTVDIHHEFKPDLVADGQVLAEIEDNRFSRWRADPPYNEKTAKEMYNCKLPNLLKLLKAGARVVKPGSLMFLLCSKNFQPCPPNVKRIGFIHISTVPNNETRILNIYVKLDR